MSFNHRCAAKWSLTPILWLLVIEFKEPRYHVARMSVLTWHGGVTVTKILKIAGLSVALVLVAASGTFALEEQKAPVTPDAAAAGAAATDTAAPAAKKDEGTEIRIPGLGRLGTLPKMDFGLERSTEPPRRKSRASRPVLRMATRTSRSRVRSSTSSESGRIRVRVRDGAPQAPLFVWAPSRLSECRASRRMERNGEGRDLGGSGDPPVHGVGDLAAFFAASDLHPRRGRSVLLAGGGARHRRDRRHIARAVGVRERLPRYSGETLDLVVDFVTYVFVPVLALIVWGSSRGASAWGSRQERLCPRSITSPTPRAKTPNTASSVFRRCGTW